MDSGIEKPSARTNSIQETRSPTANAVGTRAEIKEPATPQMGRDAYIASSPEVKSGQVGLVPARAVTDLTRDWPYKGSQAFKIDGPLWYDGTGRSITSTPTRLTMDWSQTVPGSHDPGPETPRDGKLHIRFDITLTSAEIGQATFTTVNLDVAENSSARFLKNDANARVKQDPKTGRTRVDYRGSDGPHSLEFDHKGTVWLDGHAHTTVPY